MIIRFIDDVTTNIFIKKELMNQVNFENLDELEKYLKDLFKMLDDKYNITIEGFYDIVIYIDNNYGVALSLKREDFEYYNYLKKQVDMNIITKKTKFVYEIDDINFNFLNKFETIKFNDKLYLIIKKKLTNREMLILSENSKVNLRENLNI